MSFLVVDFFSPLRKVVRVAHGTLPDRISADRRPPLILLKTHILLPERDLLN